MSDLNDLLVTKSCVMCKVWSQNTTQCMLWTTTTNDLSHKTRYVKSDFTFSLNSLCHKYWWLNWVWSIFFLIKWNCGWLNAVWFEVFLERAVNPIDLRNQCSCYKTSNDERHCSVQFSFCHIFWLFMGLNKTQVWVNPFYLSNHRLKPSCIKMRTIWFNVKHHWKTLHPKNTGAVLVHHFHHKVNQRP